MFQPRVRVAVLHILHHKQKPKKLYCVQVVVLQNTITNNHEIDKAFTVRL